jgi:segregation and condensation protein A
MEYEDLYKLILNDELGWEHLITAIVREENMDPLDIDLIKITDKFTSTLFRLKSVDFIFGGKFVYTAAILLKMKSDVVVDEILNRNLEKEDDNEETSYVKAIPSPITVVPKLPIVRERKLTLTELIDAIRTGMRFYAKGKINFDLKLKEVRMEDMITRLLSKLMKLFEDDDTVKFSSLLSKGDRKDVIYTFLPLLFIANQSRVSLLQEEPFAEIYVKNLAAS